MVLAYSGSVYNFVNKTYQFALKSAISSVGFSGSSMQDEFTISSDLSKIAIFYFLQPKDVNRTLRIFDTKTNAKICDAKLGKYVNAVRCVYSPNADQIYVGLYDRESYTKSVGLVDTKTGDLLKKSVDIPFEVDEMIIAPNGNWLAVCDWDKLIVFDKTLSTILYDIKLPFNAADFHLTVSPDSRYLSATSQNGFKGGNSVIIDTQTGVVTPLQGLAYYVAFTGDSKFVLATLKDTKANADFMTMWKLPDLKEKTATFLQLGIGTKSIIYTPDQYYMATKDAVKDVHFSKGKKTYLFDQFDLRFNRPDIILNRLGYATPEMVSAYKRAWEKRVKKMGFDPSLFDGIELKINTPEVALESQLPTTTQTPWANLEIRATDELYPIERIQIYQNGVPIFGRKGIDVKQQNVKKGTINEVFSTQKIELLQGKNVIEISAINTQGIESVRERHQLTFTRQKPLKPKLLVIAIGVSEFKNTEMNLTYAAKDADDLAALFKTKTDLYSEIEVLKFTNQNALRDSILKCKSNLLRTKVEDEVILFVASHGLLDSQLDYYIATHDVNFENPALQGLKYEDLENLLDGIPARKKIMLIDACHSGEVDKEESVLVDADTKVKVEGVTGRGFKSLKSKSLGLDNSFELMKELFTDIRRGTGAVVISSASGKEYAFESAAWKNGVFTYSLLEGLKSGNADLGQDSRISISEIRDYVSKKVEELTDGKQHPTSRSENLEVDFNIW
jgi:hypothetical protein